MLKRVKLDRQSDETKQKIVESTKDVGKYVNYQRILIFSSRGLIHAHRHLMTDLRDLLPHSRKETKFDCKGTYCRMHPVTLGQALG